MRQCKVYTFIYYILAVIVLFIFAELILRIKLLKPWNPKPIAIIVDPGGKLFKKDPVLGFTHIPGKFKIFLSNAKYFNATHFYDSLRITQPFDTYGIHSNADGIWIFGCSFTYGWLLNDFETFPWKLQEKMPGFGIINFGTNGYGTMQSLLQLQAALKERKRPKVVIITYASFHDERNTLSRGWRKSLAPWNNLGILFCPYARLGHGGKLKYGICRLEYREFPLMRYSSVMHLIEVLYNKIDAYIHRDHEVSKAIIKEISVLCKTNDIRLIVAGITADCAAKDVLRYCLSNGIEAIDIFVDLKDVSYSNLPFDGHPNSAANVIYAEKLYQYLLRN